MQLLRVLLLLACSVALPAHANWYLDNESSRIAFVSTKNQSVAEPQRFLKLHGNVDKQGKVRMRVELESIASGIPLRDERMRSMLFEIDKYPEATIEAQIDLDQLATLAPGAQLEIQQPMQLNLHGKQQQYSAELLITRLDYHRFQAVTLSPLILNIDDFALSPGLETLRNAAGLKSISPAVPVSVVLIFSQR